MNIWPLTVHLMLLKGNGTLWTAWRDALDSLCKEVRAQGYTFDIRADDLDTVAAPTVRTCSRSGMMQYGKVCPLTQVHAPQKVLACAYSRHYLSNKCVQASLRFRMGCRSLPCVTARIG